MLSFERMTGNTHLTIIKIKYCVYQVEVFSSIVQAVLHSLGKGHNQCLLLSEHLKLLFGYRFQLIINIVCHLYQVCVGELPVP